MSTGHKSEERFFYEAPSKYRKRYLKNNNNVILRSKENILNYKCQRALKKKFEKYKLRRDGLEDPDVLDISKTFHLSLKLISPRKENLHQNENIDSLKVSNYLFKMGRHRKNIPSAVKINSDMESKITDNITNKDKDCLITDIQKESVSSNKHTNAFALMMNSRNKSIGNNSPGKEKKCEVHDSLERDAQKALKLKRNLALHKMAEAKGSVQNKEVEEYKDKCIQKKMDDRADRLKDMLTKGGKTSNKKCENNLESKKDKSNMKNVKGNDTTMDDKHLLNTKNKLNETDTIKILPLVDIDLFNTPKPKITNISKDDEEFLNKLSPSIKNRNMLCYFKKVDKTVNDEDDMDYVDNSNDEINENIIKVKFSSNKKKSKKKSLSLKKKKRVKDSSVDISENAELNAQVNNDNKTNDTEEFFKGIKLHEQVGDSVIVNIIVDDETPEPEDKEFDLTSDTPRRKRKRNMNAELISTEINVENDANIKENRPKRNVKKPTKYDIDTISSDEDLHILTPKKKRAVKMHKSPLRNKTVELKKTTSQDDKEYIVIDGSDDDDNTNNKAIKKAISKTKIAPLFMPKPQIDAATLEARQKFLQSGVPEQLKKIQVRLKMQVLDNDFPVTMHVQQFDNDYRDRTLNYKYDDSDDENLEFYIEEYKFLLDCEVKKEHKPFMGFRDGVKSSLQLIKQSYPEFPVFRTYNLLKNKYNKNITLSNVDLDNSSEMLGQMNLGYKIEDPSHLNWTEKYRITFAKDIIGNFEGIKEIKRWLQTWQDNEANSKRNQNDTDSDSSDFYYNSDTDSRDSMRGVNNLLILAGPVGCGKTTSIYAVAAELSMKVIEVNVSSKRSGKIILQDLQEATQSHKVNRTKSSLSENSQNSQEIKTEGKKLKKLKQKKSIPGLVSRTKKFKTITKDEPLAITTTYSQEISRTEMSLVLIDDADIVFDQDDGFASALSQIVQCSKRPIILVTTSMTSQHLQKFFHCGNIVKMQPLLPRMLGTWLDIMCVSDVGVCWPGYGSRCLELYRGDIRKSINYMQYLFQSQANMTCEDNKDDSPCIDVEDESSNMSLIDNGINIDMKVEQTIDFSKYGSTEFSYSKNASTLWWNLPKLLLNYEFEGIGLNSKETCKKLSKIGDVMDCLSMSDMMTKREELNCILTDPWHIYETDNVDECDNYDEYSSYTNEINDAMHSLIKSSLLIISTITSADVDICLPGDSIIRSQNQIISKHHTLTESFSKCSILDRRALASDYWSICRSICRIERDKIDNNSKRKNRFYHYLRSTKLAYNNDSFDMLCGSLEK